MARKHSKSRGQKKSLEPEEQTSDVSEEMNTATQRKKMHRSSAGDSKKSMRNRSKPNSFAEEGSESSSLAPTATQGEASQNEEKSTKHLPQKSLSDLLAESPNAISPSAPTAEDFKKREESSRFTPEELLNNFPSPVPPPLEEDMKQIAESGEIVESVEDHETDSTPEVKQEPGPPEEDSHEEPTSDARVEASVETVPAKTELSPPETVEQDATQSSAETFQDTPNHLEPRVIHPRPVVSDVAKPDGPSSSDHFASTDGAPAAVQSKIADEPSRSRSGGEDSADNKGGRKKNGNQRSAEWSGAAKLFQTVGTGYASPSNIELEPGQSDQWSTDRRLFDNGLWREGANASERDGGVPAAGLDSKYNISSVEWSAEHKLYNQCPKAWLSASKSLETKRSPPGALLARDDPPTIASHAIKLSDMRDVSSYPLHAGAQAGRKLIDEIHTTEPQEPAEHLEYTGSLSAMQPSVKEETAAIAWAHQFLDKELEWRNALLRESKILTKGGPNATCFKSGWTKPTHLTDVAKSRFPSAILQVHTSTDEATLKFERDILLDRAAGLPQGPFDYRAARPRRISFWRAPRSTSKITTPQNFEQLRVANALNMHYYRMWARCNSGTLAEARRR